MELLLWSMGAWTVMVMVVKFGIPGQEGLLKDWTWVREKARNKGLSISYRIKPKVVAQHPVPSQSDTCYLLQPHLPPTSEKFPYKNSDFWEFPCPRAHATSHLCDVFQAVLFVWISLPTYTILSQSSRLSSGIISPGNLSWINFPG